MYSYIHISIYEARTHQATATDASPYGNPSVLPKPQMPGTAAGVPGLWNGGSSGGAQVLLLLSLLLLIFLCMSNIEFVNRVIPATLKYLFGMAVDSGFCLCSSAHGTCT